MLILLGYSSEGKKQILHSARILNDEGNIPSADPNTPTSRLTVDDQPRARYSFFSTPHFLLIVSMFDNRHSLKIANFRPNDRSATITSINITVRYLTERYSTAQYGTARLARFFQLLFPHRGRRKKRLFRRRLGGR